MKHYFLFSIVSFLLSSTACDWQSVKTQEQAVTMQINLDKVFDESEQMAFFDNMQIRFVPLQTVDSSLFKGTSSKMTVSENNVFFRDYEQKKIFRFTKDGKYLNQIARHGQGPEEYASIYSVFVDNNQLCIFDGTKLQHYDFDGNFIRTTKLSVRGSIAKLSDGTIAVSQLYTYDNQFALHDAAGNLLKEYSPSRPVQKNMRITRWASGSPVAYRDGACFTNYFDNSVYYADADTSYTLIDFDFGKYRISDSFFDGTSDDVCSNFNKQRFYSVMAIENFTITDDWFVFRPGMWEMPIAIYCNRKANTYMTNKGLKDPYAPIFGKYSTPDGYDAKSGQFYTSISSFDLKVLIEKMADEDPDYQSKYSFLKDIDPSQIDEEDNDWMVFFSM
ncbi:MAG: 6-bladed beta-propeller [Tannerellaceae bacterium]